LIARFRRQTSAHLFGDNRPLKYLCNVNVLTTGFDAPNVDCVAMLRPTMSPGLFYQMVGRGFRLCEGKSDCLVLDFGGNVMRHGPVDDLRVTEPGAGNGEAPAKECPECCALIHAAYAVCPECGHEFPPPQRQRHDADAPTFGAGRATSAAPLPAALPTPTARSPNLRQRGAPVAVPAGHGQAAPAEARHAERPIGTWRAASQDTATGTVRKSLFVCCDGERRPLQEKRTWK
jgi:hypothetical protein